MVAYTSPDFGEASDLTKKPDLNKSSVTPSHVAKNTTTSPTSQAVNFTQTFNFTQTSAT